MASGSQSLASSPQWASRRHLLGLCVGALGVVYGDIGTSPLYAIRECFHGEHSVAPTPANVLGVLSLILWSLVLVISVKYLGFILRADNRGEGGVLALMSLLHPDHSAADLSRKRKWLPIMFGLFGAALLYGDGMITPAISVLSAVEGLKVATPVLETYVIPLTVVVLVALFVFQRRGTAGVGAVFGPVTLVWFATISLLGLRAILVRPKVLAAVNPFHAVAFFIDNGREGFLVLGAVVLVVTGGEALYADMGHFGIKPVRWTWFLVVFPALLLNYFGQGSLLLASPQAAESPFYLLAPPWALYPLVALSTAAAVIASQAVISGSFSLTMQAVQLGYAPRLTIQHTSPKERGQIYMPQVNFILMVATIGLVLFFRSSSNLAAAYGVAVTTTMVITTVLFYIVAREVWAWPRWAVGLFCLAFLSVELGFFGASMVKVAQGGWFPLLVAAGVFTLMTTWKRGRTILAVRLRQHTVDVGGFLSDEGLPGLTRVPGVAVFLTGNSEGVPPALLHNIKHNRVLHERIVFLTLLTEDVPRVEAAERIEMNELGLGFVRVVARFGFMETPSVPRTLAQARAQGLDIDPQAVSYFLGRTHVIASGRPFGLSTWRQRLFVLMAQNAQNATLFFGLPRNRVIEIGSQIHL